MNVRSLPSQRANQRGLNLIELMIAVVIGLFISLMVVQYLSTSSKLFKQQGVDSNLESNATFAISYLSQFIRQAGSNSPIGSDVPFFTGSCRGSDPGDPLNPCTYNSDVIGESDQIAVQMVPSSRVPGDQRDCVGNEVDEGERIANVFSVVDSELFCRGYSVTDSAWLGDGESLISGVDQLQVLYGISNAEGVVDQYVDASRVAGDGLSDLEEQLAWDRVRSVKLAVLVSDGTNSGTEKPEARQYQLLDSPEIEYTDRVSRKVFTTTITINNKLQ